MRRAVVILLFFFLPALNGCGGSAEEPASTPTAHTSVSIIVSPSTSIITDESGLATTLSISLGSPPTADVTFPVNSSDTSEGSADKANLVFTSADWATGQTITITGVNDSLADGNQSYNIHLGPAVSTDASYSGLQQYITATNLDLKTGFVDVTTISGDTDESGRQATFQVKLHSKPSADVTIPVSSSDPTEGKVDQAILTFTNLSWDQYQTVNVTGVHDNLADGDIAYSIQLGTTSSTDDNYNGLDPVDLAVSNLDMRVGSLDITAISGNTDEYGLQFTFQVCLNVQPTADVEIPVLSSNPAEGTVNPASLTFTPGNWGEYQPVTVTGVEDNLVDGDKTYSIVLGPAISTDNAYNNFDPPDVTMINLGRKLGLVIVSEISGNTDEAGLQATFRVHLDSEPTDNVTIPLSSSLPSEGDITITELEFTPGNWNIDQQVTVTGVDDNFADDNRIYSINLGLAASNDTYFNGVDPADVNVTNVDLVDPYGVSPMVSAGTNHNLVLASDGTVWGWGVCTSGQLDAVSVACSSTFTLPQRLSIARASAVSAGSSFSAIVKVDDGSVWTSGNNDLGKLGHEGGGPQESLAPVSGLSNVKTVAAGSDHSLALKYDGTVWAWGSGLAGQLGDGNNTNSQTPVRALGGLDGTFATAIAIGQLHSLALDNMGKVYAWGSDGSQQLGLGTGDQSTATPTAIVNGTNTLSATAIAAGQQYSFAVGTYGTAVGTFGWGDNADSQLGTAIGTPKLVPTVLNIFSNILVPTKLAGGQLHSLALVGSQIYAWGDNDYSLNTDDSVNALGALGDGTRNDSNAPKTSFTSTVSSSVPPAMDLDTGNNYSLIMVNDGRLLTSGVGTLGQLGTNNDLDPIIIPGFPTNTTLYNHTLYPVYVEDPGDTSTTTSTDFYAYRPILSGQPATATTSTTATITVCAPAVAAYCTGITHYLSSTNNGASWEGPYPIADPITVSSPTGPVNLWVKGMKGSNNPADLIQTDASAVKVSWTVMAP